MKNLKKIINSKEFKRALKEAIEHAQTVDYVYNDEDEEVPVYTLDCNIAVDEVLTLIKLFFNLT